MSPVVRWGLLSTAHINRRLIGPMRRVPRSAVVAVASRDGARAHAYAARWDIPHAVESYDALLRRDDIDAVYISLPNSLHIPWTLTAVGAGKHVLCEKPLAACAADVDLVTAAAAEAGVIVAEGFMYRHEPLTARVAALVSDGAVGAVRTIVSGFTYARSRPDDVRLAAALDGGALLDVGCYPVSYACLLTNRDPLDAVAVHRMTASGVDEETTGVLRFPGDITAQIYAGFRGAYRTWLEVAGTEGALSVPNPFKPGPSETLVLERLGERQAFHVPGSEVLFERQIADFVAAVADGHPPVVSLAESRRVAHALGLLRAAAPVAHSRAGDVS